MLQSKAFPPVKIWETLESGVPILPAFSEGASHLQIRIIAPYPTPMHTFTTTLTKTNAIIQYLGHTYNHHPICKHHIKPTCPIGLGQDVQYMMSLVADGAMAGCKSTDMTYR